METTHLIYFADPMCSWCWGFAPTIEAVHARYGEILPIRLIMGGLRPGNTEVMTDKAKDGMRTYWPNVAEASGQPFDYDFLDREGFVYDTDPAARAVVVMRRHHPERALAFLGRAQRAFYAQNRDVTDAAVLADLAVEFGMDRDALLADHASEAAKEETWRDYATSQRAGVTGFPTLIGGPDTTGVYGIVAQGFQPPQAVVDTIDRWLAKAAAPEVMN